MRGALLLGMLSSVVGCYSYRPITTTPQPGADVSLVLTDRGRVALGERVGPEIDQLRGRVVRASETEVTLSMSESVTLRGTSQNWAGEPMPVQRELYGSARQKSLSRGRTALAAGVAGAAVLYLILRSTFDDDSPKIETDPSRPPTGGGPGTVRIPLAIRFRSH